MTMRWTTLLTPFVALLAAGTTPSHTHAQEFPSRAVTIVVPFSAGGPADTAARTFADVMRKQFSQPVVVENRPAAGGVPGTEYVAQSAHDGYTLLLGGIAGLALIPPVQKVRYAVNDFAPLGLIWRSPQVFAVRNGLPVKTAAEFVAYAKANPGKTQFGHPGHGTYAHMTQLSLQDMMGTTFNLIPYRGGPQMTTDMLGGQIDAVIDLLGSYLPLIREGKLRALAVIGNSRIPQLPDVPLLSETGINFTAEPWYGLQGPKGIPREIVDQVNAAATEILNDSAVKEKLAAAGITPRTGTPEAFEQLVKKEIEKWRPIVVKYDIKYD